MDDIPDIARDAIAAALDLVRWEVELTDRPTPRNPDEDRGSESD
jgi:hypothetical protein